MGPCPWFDKLTMSGGCELGLQVWLFLNVCWGEQGGECAKPLRINGRDVVLMG